MTAQALHDSQKAPRPPLTTSPLLREQHFGIAEGKPWVMTQEPNLTLAEHFAKGLFPVLYGRTEKFPGGESADDLACRAEQAIQEMVLPYVRQATEQGADGVHVAVVSHGLCINEILATLLKKDASGDKASKNYRGLMNTAWARVTVEVKVRIPAFRRYPESRTFRTGNKSWGYV